MTAPAQSERTASFGAIGTAKSSLLVIRNGVAVNDGDLPLAGPRGGRLAP